MRSIYKLPLNLNTKIWKKRLKNVTYYYMCIIAIIIILFHNCRMRKRQNRQSDNAHVTQIAIQFKPNLINKLTTEK